MKIREFLEKIQNSSESTKRRYLIVFTAISMVLIVGLWLIYTNSMIQYTNQQLANQNSETKFWQIFKNGLKIVGGLIKENAQNIISQIFQSNTITIK